MVSDAGEREVEPAVGNGRPADAGALLWALHRVAQLVAGENDLETVLRESLRLLCESGGFAAGAAFVPELLPAGGFFHGADPALQEATSRIDAGASSSLAGRAVERRSAAWGSDLSGDPRAEALAGAGLRSAIACPIVIGDAVAGAIELFAGSVERPDPLVLAAVEQAAAMIGRVVERSRARRTWQAGDEISSQFAAEEALRQSENRFRAIFEGAGVGLALGTADGVLMRVNRAYAEFLGYAPYELAGRNIRDLVNPDHVVQTLTGLSDLRERRVERVDLERRYLRRDGTQVWGRTTVTRLPDTDLLIAVVEDIDARKHAEAAVRTLSGRFLRLQDEERRRIARALHESAAQTVAALAMNLQRMERMGLQPHAAETLEDSVELAMQASREIRTLSHLLHPPLLEEAGLPSSLRWYVEGFGQRSNVEVTLDVAEDLGRLSTDVEIALFRVVQESLTNVHRHSGSRSASVRLRRLGPEVVLEVEDDGVGLSADLLGRVRTQSSAAVGVGIAGMRERLSQLGGSLEIEPANPGTLVRARIRSE